MTYSQLEQQNMFSYDLYNPLSKEEELKKISIVFREAPMKSMLTTTNKVFKWKHKLIINNRLISLV